MPKGFLILSIWLMLLATGCALVPVPQDQRLDDISLHDAQRLMPFALCQPAYLPAVVNPTPHVAYHNELGDPEESDVRLRYYGSGASQLVIEIYQRHAPGRLADPPFDTRSGQTVIIRELLAWQVGWTRVDETEHTVKTALSIHEYAGVRYALFEITEPDALRANMVTWGNDPVLYSLATRLSAAEARRIAEDLVACSNTW